MQQQERELEGYSKTESMSTSKCEEGMEKGERAVEFKPARVNWLARHQLAPLGVCQRHLHVSSLFYENL